MTAQCRCKWSLVAFLAFCFEIQAALAQPDIEPLVDECAACHGEDGISTNPMVPTLAGQPYTLIEDNLLAFRGGGRACSAQRDDDSPPALLAKTMCMLVAELADDEIAALAAYFESRTFEPAAQTFDAALVDLGSRLHAEKGCEGCHSDEGRTTNAMAPILAGQWKPYLRRAMQALRSGDRHGPKVMNEAIETLDDQEIEALLHFYASARDEARAQARP